MKQSEIENLLLEIIADVARFDKVWIIPHGAKPKNGRYKAHRRIQAVQK